MRCSISNRHCERAHRASVATNRVERSKTVDCLAYAHNDKIRFISRKHGRDNKAKRDSQHDVDEPGQKEAVVENILADAR